MFRWLTRFLLFRFLPRRLLPIFTVYEVVQAVRGIRNANQRRQAGAPAPGRATTVPSNARATVRR